jgi:hypothetical protein
VFIFSFLLQDAFTAECLLFFPPTEYNNLLFLLYSSFQAIRLFLGYFSVVQDPNPQLYHSASRKSEYLYRPFPLTQLFSRATLPIIQYPLTTLGTCLKMSLSSVNVCHTPHFGIMTYCYTELHRAGPFLSSPSLFSSKRYPVLIIFCTCENSPSGC